MSNSRSFLMLVLWFLLFIGWCQCAYKFVKCDFDPKTSLKAEVLYGVGTFTGLGGVLGWFDFGK